MNNLSVGYVHARSFLGSCALMFLICSTQVSFSATPGLPFTEDFSDSSLRNAPATTANWSIASRAVEIDRRNARINGLRSDNVTARDISSESLLSWSIKSADLNGDGYADVIEGHRSNAIPGFLGVSVHMYDSAGGGFNPVGTPLEDYTASGHNIVVHDIDVGDVDADGDQDIVLTLEASPGSQFASERFGPNLLYLNNGDPNTPFAGVAPIQITGDNEPSVAIELADLNCDGLLDVVVGNGRDTRDFTPYDNRYYLNEGAPNLFSNLVSGTQISNDLGLTNAITVADFNSDGFPDIVSTGVDGTRLYLHSGNCANPFDAATVGTLVASADSNGNDVVAGDIDNDGHIDLVIGRINQTNRYVLNNGTGFDGLIPTLAIGSEADRTESLRLADLDSDGDLDIVAATYGGRDQVYLNNGSSAPFDALSLPRQLSADTLNSTGIDVVDVDQDGDYDAVVATQGLNRLYVNEATGRPFTDANGDDVGTETSTTWAMDYADIDNDGDLDLVVSDSNRALMYLNNGSDEPFSDYLAAPAELTLLPVGSGSVDAIKIDDLNGDGLKDVLIGSRASPISNVTLFTNTGTAPYFPDPGTLIAQASDNGGAFTQVYTSDFAVADIDRDGDRDVVVGTYHQDMILYNDGDLVPFDSIAPVLLPTVDGTDSLRLGDLNRDGLLDLVVGNGTSVSPSTINNYYYLHNGTSNPYNNAIQLGTEANITRGIELVDLNRDGFLDVLIANSSFFGGGVVNRVFFNDGSGDPFDTVSGQNLSPDLMPTTDLAVGDIDRDGNYDIVTSNNYGERLRMYEYVPGSDPATMQGADISEGSFAALQIALADFNNDGDEDVFVGIEGVNRLYQNEAATEAFNTVVDIPIDVTSYLTVPVNLGDFNNDGRLDVVSGVWGGINLLNLNNGTAMPFDQAGQDIGGDALFTQALAVGDVNADGLLDIVSGNNSANNLLHLNSGGPTLFTGAGLRVANVDETDVTRDLILADLNRDGHLDVVAGNQGVEDKIYFHSGNNAAPYNVAATNVFALVFNTRVIRAGDIDNDGDLDIVTGNDSSAGGNNTGGNAVFFNNGSGSFLTGYWVESGIEPADYDKDDTYGLALGDINGDGLLDLVVGNLGQPNRYYLNDGSAQPFLNTASIDIGSETDNTRVVVLEDLDQDGDLDLVVANVGGTDKYYLNSGDPVTPFDASSIAVALPNTANPVNPTSFGAVAGDVDGDGNNDLIVGDFGGQDHFYRSAPFDLARTRVVSQPVDTASNMLAATLTSTQQTPFNTDIEWFMSNNNGATFYQVTPGQEFVFPQAGDDLIWKAELRSLSPKASSIIQAVNIDARFDGDLDFVLDDLDVCVGTDDPDQIDTDGDALPGISTGPANGGDACDADDDNDGTPDVADAFPLNPLEDNDTDGNCPDNNLPTSGNGCGDNSDPDIDGDGIPNASDPFDFNVAPTISGTPGTVGTPDSLYQFAPVVTDGGDGDGFGVSLAFEGGTAANLPAWLSFNSSTGVLSGVPSNDDYVSAFGDGDNAVENIVITVTDSAESASLGPFSITITDTRAPTSLAVPAGANYNDDVDVTLFCLEDIGSGCATIRYTTDDALPPASFPAVAASTTTIGIPDSANVNLRFYSVDVAGNAGPVVSEAYNFDLDFPAVSIVTPADGEFRSVLDDIDGTSSDVGTGVVGVEIQITDGSNSVLAAGGNLVPGTPVWLPVTDTGGATPYSTWNYNRGSLVWQSDVTYIVNARATDDAGNVTTTSSSFTFYSGAPAATSLQLTLTNSVVPANETTDASLTFTRLNNPGQDQTGTELTLEIVAPDATLTDVTTTANFAGQATVTLGGGGANNIVFDQPGLYTVTARFAGNIQMAASDSGTANLLVGTSAGYAVIVQGKLPTDSGLASHNKTANRIYDTLKDRGFADQDIFYFNYDDNQLGVDAVPTEAAIQAAIESLAPEIAARPAPVYVIMVDHGGEVTAVSEAVFYIDAETITPTELDSWLDTLETSLDAIDPQLRIDNPRVVIIGACYSGGFIPALSDSGRVVISSATSSEQSYKGPTEDDGIRVGEYFLEELFLELGDGNDLRGAFQVATEKTEEWTRGGDLSANSASGFADDAVQHPLLDDDGDAAGTNAVFENTSDGTAASQLFLGFNQDSLTNDAFIPADIVAVTDTLYLDFNTSNAQLTLFANDPFQVNQAYVEIREPDKVLDVNGDNTTEQLSNDFVRRAFTPPASSGAPYTLDYAEFDQAGLYEIFYYVNDRFTGALSAARRSLVYRDRLPGADTNDPPNPFTLISPGTLPPWDGVTTNPTVFALDWEDAGGISGIPDPDGDDVTYTLMIADDPGFDSVSLTDAAGACQAGNPIYRQQQLDVSSTVVIQDARLCDDKTYYWKVLAVDEFGQNTESTDTFVFHTDNTNAVPGTIVALVQSNATSALLTGVNVVNDFLEGATEVAVATYNGNYIILTNNFGAQVVTGSRPGYQVTTANVTIGSAEQKNILLSMPPGATLDSDGDGIFDINDNCPATNDVDQTDTDGDGSGNPCDLDDDNDGMSDAFENGNGLNPTDPTDAGIDPDGDGATNLEEAQFGTDPQSPDPSYLDDDDADSVVNINDNCPAIYNPLQENLDGDADGDVCDEDSDGDGMTDAFEILYNLLPMDPSDAGEDPDADGKTNLQEYAAGTNPRQLEAAADDGGGGGGSSAINPLFILIVAMLGLLCYRRGRCRAAEAS